MEAKSAHLEAAYQRIQRDIAALKHDVRAIKKDIKSIRAINFRTLLATLLVSFSGLAGMLAKGFGWI